jgi:hypothetical protein
MTPKDGAFQKLYKKIQPDTMKKSFKDEFGNENDLLRKGQYFNPNPDDDHDAHITMHMMEKSAIQQKVFRRLAPAESLMAIERHIEDHRVFKAEKKSQPAPVAEVPEHETESLDTESLKSIYNQFARVYSGEWIAKGLTAWKAGQFEQAEFAFQMARDGFQKDKNPTEWKTLEAWRKASDKKGNNNGEEKGKPNSGANTGAPQPVKPATPQPKPTTQPV